MTARRGEDLRFDLTLNFRKAILGGEETFQICCLESCQVCKETKQKRGIGDWFRGAPPTCNSCNGSGLIEAIKSITINIPAGVEQGSRLKLSGEGNVGEQGGATGDLYIFLSVQQDSEFQRDGADLLSEVLISEEQATSGCEIEVNTINGIEALTIPPQTQPNTVLVLQSLGVPMLGNSRQRGNHLVTVKVGSTKWEDLYAHYAERGQYQKIVDMYSKVIQSQSDNDEAYLQRGLVKGRNLNNFEAAIADFSKAIELNPGNFHSYQNRGLARSLTGNKDEAIQDFSTAIKINPNLPEAYFNRAKMYTALDEHQLAIDDYSVFLQIHPSADVYCLRANAYASINDYTAAINDYTQAITLDPNHAAAYTKRGCSYLKLGDRSSGIADLEKALQLMEGTNLPAYSQVLSLLQSV
jgi:tetratricopeptide (TPR) repeat protein